MKYEVRSCRRGLGRAEKNRLDSLRYDGREDA
jgi:hypothetical protein